MHRLVYTLTPEVFRIDTQICKARLEDLVGRPVLGYRAPSYSITRSSLWALDTLVELGFQYETSIFPVRHFARFPVAAYITPGGGHIDEFPLTTFRVAGQNLPSAGGGYLRMLPMAWTHAEIRAAQAAGQPAMLYLHPSEIDADQPRISGLSPLRRARCDYYYLARVFERLRTLLTMYQCDTVGEVLEATLGRPAQPGQ